MFYWIAKRGKFSIDKTDPHCSVVLSKTNVLLLICCKLKTILLPRVNFYKGVPLRQSVNKRKNPVFVFKSVRVRLQEGVRLRECVNTEFDWEEKTGI